MDGSNRAFCLYQGRLATCPELIELVLELRAQILKPRVVLLRDRQLHPDNVSQHLKARPLFHYHHGWNADVRIDDHGTSARGTGGVNIDRCPP